MIMMAGDRIKKARWRRGNTTHVAPPDADTTRIAAMVRGFRRRQ